MISHDEFREVHELQQAQWTTKEMNSSSVMAWLEANEIDADAFKTLALARSEQDLLHMMRKGPGDPVTPATLASYWIAAFQFGYMVCDLHRPTIDVPDTIPQPGDQPDGTIE